ncbi:flagellar biosynthesis protein FlhA [Sphingomonas sp. BT-65]|uniref:flagellar biosynthesis protein FlhA n=1 Tax=Sphingomonas sp. BT-65 TaxID=2989821 RepID=UPI00223607C5|nr:flagellar biosynthesis protein FlhA [Sphingomonas sp. BT-65]MCW4460981.1 flagellar biosynthesis protein FlhA [Sphingomonas sp. BT-65]
MSVNSILSRLPPMRLRTADLLLAIGVVAIVGLLILPLPALAIDFLVAMNITIGVLLLLSTLYVTKPLDFSTFPAVLLLSTLFRLALSIATTRMILTEAHAGHIVQQFGEMVAGGELVVGLVVFLIITIVQFVVISKGAERVAEVAARFSLDAMPGKQLSIDSDLRSGLITKDEARARRRTLENESKLHGSLDGAMKFVKGDAIASIIIVLVNLIGGLAIGIFSKGMPASEAIETYSILTIGDGLVAQIPALFSAMAAGLLVTRTTDEEQERDLGPAIARQMSGKPRVLFIAAGVSVVMAMIPGFPVLVFLSIATLLAGSGAMQHPASRGWINAKWRRIDTRPAPLPEMIEAKPAPLRVVRPLLVEVAASGMDTARATALTTAVTAMLERMQERSGLPLPAAEIEPKAVEFGAAGKWAVYIHDAPIAAGVLDDPEDPARIVPAIETALRRELGRFLGLQEVTALLNRIGIDYPDVVKEVVRAVPAARIAEVLRLLAEEEVPLRNMRDVLEAIAEAGQAERNAIPIADLTRCALRRYLSLPHCVEGRFPVLVVGAALERFLRDNVRTVDGVARLAMEPDHARTMIAMLKRETKASGARAILTAFELRRPLRRLVGPDLFEVPVLAFNELSPTVPLDVVGQLDRTPIAIEKENSMGAAA